MMRALLLVLSLFAAGCAVPTSQEDDQTAPKQGGTPELDAPFGFRTSDRGPVTHLEMSLTAPTSTVSLDGLTLLAVTPYERLRLQAPADDLIVWLRGDGAGGQLDPGELARIIIDLRMPLAPCDSILMTLGYPHASPTTHAWWMPAGSASGVVTLVDREPNCTSTPAQRSPAVATQEVSSNLKVVGVYGVRNSTSEGLWDLKINAELSAGARTVDVSKLIVRYSDGTTTRNYAHHVAAIPDGAMTSTHFNATWIRGVGGATYIMEAGDLVELHFNLINTTLPTRTDVSISLIPEIGSPVAADFRTPATYSTSTTITLR